MEDPNLAQGSADIQDQVPVEVAMQRIKEADKEYNVTYSLGWIEIVCMSRVLTSLNVPRHGLLDPKAVEAALVVAALRKKEIVFNHEKGIPTP